MLAVIGKPPMFGIIRDAVRAVWSAMTRAKDLAAENVALRHQLDVVLRPTSSGCWRAP